MWLCALGYVLKKFFKGNPDAEAGCCKAAEKIVFSQVLQGNI